MKQDEERKVFLLQEYGWIPVKMSDLKPGNLIKIVDNNVTLTDEEGKFLLIVDEEPYVNEDGIQEIEATFI